MENVIDVREDEQPESETDYESCMMCGNEKIRYVHVVSHPEVAEEYRVGCVCAERMTDDYTNPKEREKELRNRASRRSNWSKKEWRLSRNGNYYLRLEGNHLLIFQDEKSGKFKLKIGGKFGNKSFDSVGQAKKAAFDGVEYLKEKGEW